ncbi:MAG: hypothetical protein JXA82_10635 [Sedimentisphaerales bacterium]|nr:hypothetical protein [Sedimentisphaerales bacterium]
MDRILAILVFVPLAAGFCMLFAPRSIRTLLKWFALLVSIAAFISAIRIFAGQADTFTLVLPLQEFQLDLLLAVTDLNKFILLFATGFGLLIVLYSLKINPDMKHQNAYYGSILMAIGGSAGILLTNHLLWLLIFWEIVTASLYLLISTGGEKCKFAATKSFAMIGASDGAFLLGLAMVWTLSGDVNGSGTFIISELNIGTTSGTGIVAFLLLMTAAVTKAGAMPLHTWLPTSGQDSHASVMAILPAALDKLLGIYLLVLLVKDIFVLQAGALTLVLSVIGSATILVAVMIAMVQHNVKKLLSYHAISQVGYMVLGIATLTPVGIAGGVFHMLNHTIYKCCLFLCGGAVEKAAGTAELEEMGGLGNKMPWTFVACLIGALSISGIPPFNGFVSKWMVYQGVIEMGSEQLGGSSLWPLWLFSAMFGSALTLASFVKILHSIFLSRRPTNMESVREVPVTMIVPMIVLAFLCVLFGVAYFIPLDYFIYPALQMTRSGGEMLGIWDSATATILLIIGTVLGGFILLLSMRTKTVRSVPTWSCGEIQPNDQMIIPGTHFYKTISSLPYLRRLYHIQEKGWFDPYDHGGRIGLGVSGFLKWLHSGLLSTYLTWVAVGLLLTLGILCQIWKG